MPDAAKHRAVFTQRDGGCSSQRPTPFREALFDLRMRHTVEALHP